MKVRAEITISKVIEVDSDEYTDAEEEAFAAVSRILADINPSLEHRGFEVIRQDVYEISK